MIDADADGEALDDRDRHVADEPAGAGVPEPDQDQPGEQPDHQHPVGAVRRDDRHQDHGHRAGRAADLDPAAAEHRGQGAGHDRGDQPGGGAHARAHAEAEGQRQSHQPDHHPGGQVSPGAHVRPVRAAAAGSRTIRARRRPGRLGTGRSALATLTRSPAGQLGLQLALRRR